MFKINLKSSTIKNIFTVIIISFFIFAFFLIKLESYLLFHSLAESFSIIIYISIFILVWNSSRYFEDGFLKIFGIAALFIAGIDLLHMLSFKGINIFSEHDTNLPTQLWVAGRYLQSLSLIVASIHINRKININLLLILYLIIFSLLLLTIFYWKIFPACFIEASGLTLFKKVSEYIISFLFLASLIPLYKKKSAFNKELLILLFVSIIITVFSELCFTLYKDPYAIFNFIGHMLKIIAVYLLYKAVVKKGLRYPNDLLFKNLLDREEELKYEKDKFEKYLNLSAEIIIIIDLNQKVTMINKKGCEILGYKENEILGKNWFDNFVSENIKEKIKDDFLKLTSNKTNLIEHSEYSIKTKNGKECIIAWNNNILRDENGDIIASLSAGNDVTLNKQIEESYMLSQFCIDKAADGFIWIESNAKIIYANEKACHMYGYTKAELETMSIDEIAPNFSKDVWPARWESIKTYGSYILEAEHSTKKGRVFPVEVTVNYIKFNNKEFNCSIIRDISERKKIEESLKKAHNKLEFLVNKRTEELALANQNLKMKMLEIQQNEEMLSRILETLPVGVWVLDKSGNIRHANPAGKNLFEGSNYSNKTQIDNYNRWWLESAVVIRQEELNVVKTLSENTKLTNNEIEIECFDGSHKIILSSSVQIKNKNGEINGTIIVNQDITERKIREKKTEISNRFLLLLENSEGKKKYIEGILDVIMDIGKFQCAGIRLLNSEGNIPYESYKGFSQEFWESEGSISLDCNCVCSRVVKGTLDLKDYSFITEGGSFLCGNNYNLISELSDQDNQIYRRKCIDFGYSSIAVIPIKHGEKILGAIHIADKQKDKFTVEFIEFIESLIPLIGEGINKFDMSEKIKQAKEELDMAKRLSDIGILAATVAHELRNPLAAIRMASYNIQKKSKDSNLEKHILNIDKKVSESDQIINNLLYYTRIRTIEYQNINIYELLNESVNYIKARFLDRNIKINKRYKMLNDRQVDADPLLIKEVIENILNNSYDAVIDKEGIIEIGAKIKNKNIFEIYFKDNGVGIDSENINKLFEPFFTTKSKGTGLGLAVCKQIITLHNGEIKINSKIGTGTTITISLPFSRIAE